MAQVLALPSAMLEATSSLVLLVCLFTPPPRPRATLVAVDVCVSYGTRSPPWAAHDCVICSRQLLGNNTLSYRTMSPIRSPLLSPVALGLGPGEGGCTGAMVV